jgi:hypothetical protein
MASVSPNPPTESQLLFPMPSGAETGALRENELRAMPANRKPRNLRAMTPGRVPPPLVNAEILADLAQGIFLDQWMGRLGSDQFLLTPLASSIEGEGRARLVHPSAVR